MAMAMPMLPILSWRWQLLLCRWRGGDGDAVAADGVAMATTVLPIARVVMAWRGDDVATKFELAMAMAMPLRPTALRWRCRYCRWRVCDGVAMAMTLLPMAMAWQ